MQSTEKMLHLEISHLSWILGGEFYGGRGVGGVNE